MTTLYPQTNAIFSPDDKYVVTGVGDSSKGAHGKLLFMSKDSLEIVKELAVGSTPVKVVWHSKINQVSRKIILSRLWGLFSFRSIGTRSTPGGLSIRSGSGVLIWIFLPLYSLCDNQDRDRII